jgi:hypothetical protein
LIILIGPPAVCEKNIFFFFHSSARRKSYFKWHLKWKSSPFCTSVYRFSLIILEILRKFWVILKGKTIISKLFRTTHTQTV